MEKVNIEIELDPSEWEVLIERARREYPYIKKEMDELGEPFTLEDALRVEIQHAIAKDVELFDIFDAVRNDPVVKKAVNDAILRRKSEWVDE